MFNKKNQNLKSTAVLSQSNQSSCVLRCGDVLRHLDEMKRVYDRVLSFTKPHQLYEFLLNTEQDYIEKQTWNYAHTVHMLHPLIYMKDSRYVELCISLLFLIDNILLVFVILILFEKCPRSSVVDNTTEYDMPKL